MKKNFQALVPPNSTPGNFNESINTGLKVHTLSIQTKARRSPEPKPDIFQGFTDTYIKNWTHGQGFMNPSKALVLRTNTRTSQTEVEYFIVLK
ncbi:hypothetical protein CDAR_219131 [Caerostris darwini]|uniref:Uncharacterized protein n=1 Tax=Caerostris darwini TaxID=1538125 RepID=A0AAV4S284_9ARAC|nr:hypothetical protein CDAR_219131 [Caerostris darwini]